MSEPLNAVESAIHAAICEGSPQDCKDWRGRCVKAAEAARPPLFNEAAEVIDRFAEKAQRAPLTKADLRGRPPWHGIELASRLMRNLAAPEGDQGQPEHECASDWFEDGDFCGGCDRDQAEVGGSS